MKARLVKILDNIALSQRESGLSSSVTIVGATKLQPISTLETARELGINIFGENRTNELVDKYGKINGVSWHFIGRLQTNKVKYICDKVDMIQSVDSEKLALQIDRKCREIDKIMPILIEVNIGNESQKGGISVCELPELVSAITKMPNIKLCGFMTVMPIGADEKLYVEMKNLFDQYAAKLGEEFNTLSMGMSDDYQIAVKCGATMIRLGRVLFGERR